MCVQYIGGCSVHREVFSISGGVQYIGGISWVHRGISWVHRGDIMSTSGGYHDECGGIPWVHRGMFSTSEGYHEYIGGIPWEHRGISWVHWRMFSTSEGIMIHVGGNLIKSFQFLLKTPMYWTSPDVLNILRCTHDIPWCTHDIPRCTHGIPQCTEHPPMYSWYPPTRIMISPDVLNIPRCTHDIPPDVLMVSLQCTEHPPMYSWYPSDVLNTPLMYSWYPPDVLMVSPRCTEHPPMYWTSPDVLNIPRCTEHPPMYWTHIIQGVNSIGTSNSVQEVCIQVSLMWCVLAVWNSYLAVQTLRFYITCFIRESCTGVNKILHILLQIIYKLNVFNILMTTLSLFRR